MCDKKYTQLCSDEKCLLCYKRSFVSFQDKKKVNCLVDVKPRFICKTTKKNINLSVINVIIFFNNTLAK